MFRVRRWSSFLVALFVVACGGGGGSGAGSTDDVGSANNGIQIRWVAAPGVAGYVIHWGVRSAEYSEMVDVGLPTAGDAGVVSYVLYALESPGTYFFAMTSYDESGVMSSFSNEIAVEVP